MNVCTAHAPSARNLHAKTSGCQPAPWITSSSDWRTESSQSTTNTMGGACELGDAFDSWLDGRAVFISVPRLKHWPMERLTLHVSSVVPFRERPVSGVSGIWHRRRAQYRGHVYQVDERAGLHLSHHLAAVCLHRDLADAELATDLFIQFAGDHQIHDLSLASGERGVTVAERPPLRFLTQYALASIDRFTDRA